MPNVLYNYIVQIFLFLQSSNLFFFAADAQLILIYRYKVSSLLFSSKMVLSEAIAPFCLPPTFMPRRLGAKTVTDAFGQFWKMTPGKETKI